MTGTCDKCGQALAGGRCPDWCDVDNVPTACECCGDAIDPNGECPCDWGWTDCQTSHPRTVDDGCGHEEAEPSGCVRCDDGERLRDAERASSWSTTTDVAAVWRGRVEPGAVVSWRHPNPNVNRREVGTVVAVGPDALTVDVTDRAGTYRARLTIAELPGLTVDVRPFPNGPAR